MSRTESAAQVFTDARDFRERQLRKWVHLLYRGSKNEICTGALADFQVFRKCSRIFRIILIWAELKRIHKNADRKDVCSLSCGLDQQLMAGMEGAHRGHKADYFAGFSRRP